jgi:fatty-acyl-CoA synthase
LNFNFATILTKRAQLEPNRPAIVFGEHTFSFREFNERSNRLSHALTELGVERGYRVGILLGNCNEFIEAFFGMVKIGAICVPLNWRLSPPELESISRHSGIDSLVFSTELSESAEAIKSRLRLDSYVCVDPEAPAWAKSQGFIDRHSASEPKYESFGNDPALIIYTAGTTGPPKGALLTHSHLFWWCHSLSTTLGFSRGPLFMVLPLFHGFALDYFCAAVLMGCTTVLMKTFDAHKALDAIRRERAETFPAVPTMLQLMSQVPNFEKYMDSVRLIISGGAPLSSSLRQIYLDHGLKIWNVLGLTEAGAVATLNPERAAEKDGSAGLPFHYMDVRVVDEGNLDVAAGHVGELLVRGPLVISEYWHNPDATKAAIEGGWFRTGDLVRLDEEDYIYIVGRKRDLIVSGAEKIYPDEVESLLHSHPKIAEVAIIGQPDEIWGETVCAVVRVKPGETLTAPEITDFCQGRLARFKIPKRIIFTDTALPRNAAGKVLRTTLQQKLNLPEK